MKMGMTLLSVLTILFLIFVCLPASFAQNTSSKNLVRLIYFLPNDRAPQPGIDTKLDRQIKDAQLLFADLLEEHGFERKTFHFETDARGQAVVHRVNGRFAASHYYNSPEAAWAELPRQFDRSKDIYLFSIDVGIFDPVGDIVLLDPAGNPVGQGCFSDACGIGTWRDKGASGLAAVPPIDKPAVAHELGHAFGLMHDYRRLVPNRDSMLVSFCAAEWLDVNRYFNDFPPSSDAPTTIRMLPPLAAPSYAIRLRFEVSDPDGLHQAQLQILPTEQFEGTSPKIIDNKSLNSERATVEFVTTELIGGSTTAATKVWLQVTDVLGNFTVQEFTINIASLLPRPKAISVPDDNLAAAIRRELGMAPRAAITQLNMLSLQRRFDVGSWSKIIDLTGLGHAINLKQLSLFGNQISDLGPLAGLTQLKYLGLGFNQIRDVTPLAGLTQLTALNLNNNQITDITPLAGLTQLTALNLNNNQIRDITPLAGLTQLRELRINNNQINDTSSLTSLVNLEIFTVSENSPEVVSVPDDNLEEVSVGGNPLTTTPSIAQVDFYLGSDKVTVIERGKFIVYSGADRTILNPAVPATVKMLNFDKLLHSSNLTGFFDQGGTIELLTLTEAEFGDVVISEIMWGLDKSAPNNQWIELYNTTSNDITLEPGGWAANWAFQFSYNTTSEWKNVKVHGWKVIDRVSNIDWKVPGQSGNTSQNQPLISMYRDINYETGSVPDGTLANSWKASTGRVNLLPPSYGTPGAKHLPPSPVVVKTDPVERPTTPIDPSQPAIYWSGNGIQRANLDGSNVRTLVTEVDVSDITLDVTGGKMYWINYESIQRANLDGSNVETLVNTHGVQGTSELELTLDVLGGKMYWKHWKWDEGTSKIQRANLDGSNIETLVEPDYVFSPTLDVSSGKIYWLDNIGIRRANLDGSNVETLAREDTAWQFTLDVARGKMYWLDNIGIRRANLDGSNIETLVKGGSTQSFTLDVLSGKMYWTGSGDRSPSEIQCANLDGSNVQTLVREEDTWQLTLDVADGKMYWIGRGAGGDKLQRANLDGSNIEDISATSGGPFVLIPSQAPADDASPAAVRKTTQVHVDAADRPPMYWIDGGVLYRLAGAEVERIAASANDVAVDMTGGKIYWIEGTSDSTGRIHSANVDGIGATVVKELTSVPMGLALDSANGKLYLTNSWGKIQRINVDGTGFESAFIGNVNAPVDIAVASNRVYWADTNRNVWLANIASPNSPIWIATASGTISGIAAGSSKVYWTEQTETTHKVRSANLDGSGVADAFSVRAAPHGIAIDTVDGKVYWSDAWGNIQRSNLDGTGYQVVVSNLITATALAIGGENADETAIAAAPARVVAPPAENLLLPNYPNPFNPETWIPYQLAESADVTLTIYDINGRVVQHLDLGHQRAGVYQGKARAAYWDGRNAQGEPVASGLYFYTLKAGDFSATKKMLIQK